MKLLVKSSFTIFLALFIVNISYAQKKKRAPYSAVVNTEDKKIHGKITAINETGLVLVDRNEATQSIPYQNITRIKVLKAHNDVGYGIVTGALAAGTIVAANSVDDSAVAVIVGVGGTAAVVGLSMVLHGVIHGPEVKMKASRETIDYKTVSEKLTKYIVNDASLRP